MIFRRVRLSRLTSNDDFIEITKLFGFILIAFIGNGADLNFWMKGVRGVLLSRLQMFFQSGRSKKCSIVTISCAVTSTIRAPNVLLRHKQTRISTL